ncbi:MAG: hypothetical protein BWY72_02052 [Bacteroidetes bacterium ADurb.Bin416]|nr:MAG: hypothetical protein BWY72_02052 [Bacteroidetes bacterium ADurb.Bin416]
MVRLSTTLTRGLSWLVDGRITRREYPSFKLLSLLMVYKALA